MTIAELYVNLGVKGTDKTTGAFSTVQKGLGETAHMALETKAAIIAAVYAFERLAESSLNTGTNLTNFSALTGVASKTLQQYQYAGRLVGATNEDVSNSFKALQSAMAKTLMGEGAPAGMGRLALLTGGEMTQADVERYTRNPELLMKRLQQYALTEKNLGLRNEVLKSFGMSDNMIAALSRNAFQPQTLRRAPTIGMGEAQSLDRARSLMQEAEIKVQRAFDHFFAKNAPNFAKDILTITDATIKLADSLQKLSDKFGILEKATGFLKGIANTFHLLGEISDALGGKAPQKGDMLYTSPGQEALPGWGAFLKKLSSPFGELSPEDQKDWDRISENIQKRSAEAAHPKVSGAVALPWGGVDLPRTERSTTKTNNVTVNQQLQFHHDGKDAHKTADSTKQAVQHAFRTYQGVGQTN